MVRVSNGLIATLNVAFLLLSVPLIGGGLWLASKASSASLCEKSLDRPLIVLGAFLLVISLAGLIGSCRGLNWIFFVYLAVMLVLIVLLFCFTVFAFAVTNKGVGEAVSGRGYKEYKLGDYSHWLQKRVGNEGNWKRIRSCLVESKVCRGLQERNQSFGEFINQNLSPIQSGCCKPPSACNFTYRSETIWDKPAGFSNKSSIGDCNAWQNDQSQLCFGCESCKAGVLANIKHNWKKVAIFNIALLIFLIVVYSIGCCAFRNNRSENSYRMKGYP